MTAVLAELERRGLEPRVSGGAIRFRCPSCDRRRAFIYANSESGWWRCNRRNECGAQGFIKPGVGDGPRPKRPMRSGTTGRARDLSGDFGPRAANLDDKARAYLKRRFGRLAKRIAKNCRPELFNPAAADAPHSKHRADQGYSLGLKLRDLCEPSRVSSAVYRWTQRGKPPTKKSMTAGGSAGGRFGAVFGDAAEALAWSEAKGGAEGRLRRAFGRPVLVLAEGDADWLLLRGGLESMACIGVSGAGRAPSVVRWLQSKGWRGWLLLALDNDPAGRKAGERVKSLLNGQDDIGLLVADLDDGFDIADTFKAGGEKAVWAALEGARAVELKQVKDRTPARFENIIPEDARRAFIGHAKKRPPRAEVRGSSRPGRQGRCGLLGHGRDELLAGGGIGESSTEVRLCGLKTCPSCRHHLLLHNEELLKSWGANSQVYRLVRDFDDAEDVEAHVKERARLMRNTGRYRKGERYGLVSVMNPGSLEVYISGPDAIRWAAERSLGVKAAALDGEELREAFEDAVMGLPEWACATAAGGGDISADPWIRHMGRQLTIKGELLPFKASVATTKPQDEAVKKKQEQKQEAQTRVLHTLVSYHSAPGVLAITTKPMDDANADRAFYGRALRLWEDLNLAGVLVNRPEWFNRFPRLRDAVSELIARRGGLSEKVKAGFDDGATPGAFDTLASALEEHLRPEDEARAPDVSGRRAAS